MKSTVIAGNLAKMAAEDMTISLFGISGPDGEFRLSERLTPFSGTELTLLFVGKEYPDSEPKFDGVYTGLLTVGTDPNEEAIQIGNVDLLPILENNLLHWIEVTIET